MPKISIIIPVYNVEKYLRRCLDSVLNQTYNNFEIICIDDCSLDSSKEILIEYVRSHGNKIRVLYNESNLGLGKTRERGIEAASGEYLMFIDSDDYVKEDFVDTYVNAVREADYDVIIGGYIRDINGKLIQHKAVDSVWGIVSYTIACAKMFRKFFLVSNNIKFSEIRCGEDIFFSMCVFCADPSYRVINYAGYYYYLNKESITGSLNYDRKFEKFISCIFNEFLEIYDLKSMTIEKQRIIEYNYIANMINALIVYGHGCGINKMAQKYCFFMNDLKKKFPDYKNNPYIGVWVPKGQTLKIRIGVGIIMKLHRMHIDKIIFYFVSLL